MTLAPFEPSTTPPAAVPNVPLPQVRDEAIKAAELASMKRKATGLLVIAALVFLAAAVLEPHYHWVSWVRAGAEAAMVGGLADWFAVTALFRHPLGIPIPHTAIIPTRKERIARILADFFERNFFTREVLAERLHQLGLAERLGSWLANPENSRAIARQLVRAAAGAADAVPEETARAFVDRSIVGRLRSIPAAPVAARAIESLMTDGKHQELLDRMLNVVNGVLDKNGDFIRKRIGEESPWWVPDAAEQKLYEKVVGGIERTLQAIAEDPAHPLRGQFDVALRDFAERLKSAPRTIERAEEIKEDLLKSPAVLDLSGKLWGDVKSTLRRYADDPEGDEPPELERAIQSFGASLLADEALRARIDKAIAGAVAGLAEKHRSHVGELITETVSRWDGAETARRLELQVGRDLQYVRINGTLVGGLVGLLLHLLRQVL
jgi:uncharacterized membrane-anchored protein YjiN (DUF445 family)